MGKKNQQIDITEFEALDFKEELSEKELEQIKKNVLERIHKMDKKKIKSYKWRKWKVAAVIVLVMTPASVFAASKINEFFQSKVNQDSYHLNVDIETKDKENEKDSIQSTDKQFKNVRLVYEKLEEYTIKKKGNGWYSFSHKEGFNEGKDFGCELIYVDQTVKDDFFIDDISVWEDEIINGNKTIYIERNEVVGSQYHSNTEYTKRVLVFYEDKNYILQFYAMEGIEKEQMFQYASSIRLEECEESRADEYISLSQYISYHNTEGEDIANRFVKKGQVINQNETASYNGIDYQVKDVQVLSNISSLFKENGKGFCDAMNIWEERLEYSDNEGNLKSYIREEVEYGDGYTKPYETVVSSKEIAQKFVMVELRVKNTTKTKKEGVMICLPINYLIENGNEFAFAAASYNRPEVIRNCQLDSYAQYFRETNGGKGFYMKDLEAGEEQIYHIGYFVDKDLLERMFLSLDEGTFNEEGYDGIQIDIRQ